MIRYGAVERIANCYAETLYTNPLSANPTKWSNTLKQFLILSEHCERLALQGLSEFGMGKIMHRLKLNVEMILKVELKVGRIQKSFFEF